MENETKNLGISQKTMKEWVKSPPMRLESLARAAVAHVQGMKQRITGEAIVVVDPSPQARSEAASSSSKDSVSKLETEMREEEECSSMNIDDILKISHIMACAGVWEPVRLAYRSDLSNQMLSLKCADTAGDFSERRQEVVRSNIPVTVHLYRKSIDGPLARKALENTRELYQKRIREFFEVLFGSLNYVDELYHILAQRMALDLAAQLKVNAEF
jgi:hypothetical protein